jgi:hypothetical protein
MGDVLEAYAGRPGVGPEAGGGRVPPPVRPPVDGRVPERHVGDVAEVNDGQHQGAVRLPRGQLGRDDCHGPGLQAGPLLAGPHGRGERGENKPLAAEKSPPGDRRRRDVHDDARLRIDWDKFFGWWKELARQNGTKVQWDDPEKMMPGHGRTGSSSCSTSTSGARSKSRTRSGPRFNSPFPPEGSTDEADGPHEGDPQDHYHGRGGEPEGDSPGPVRGGRGVRRVKVRAVQEGDIVPNFRQVGDVQVLRAEVPRVRVPASPSGSPRRATGCTPSGSWARRKCPPRRPTRRGCSTPSASGWHKFDPNAQPAD